MATLPSREEAWKLLTTHVRNENLLRHALGVEAAMRACAERLEQDADLWGITGLLHDVDYEECSDTTEHGHRGALILDEAGYPARLVDAVITHPLPPDRPRTDLLEKALMSVDDLVGMIVAVALVRPSRSLTDVKPSSVKKKMKDKAFARGANREAILRGAESLGLSLDEHLAVVIRALQGIAAQLGL
jgi:putative nucleotidyltransferase with HDIG domain